MRYRVARDTSQARTYTAGRVPRPFPRPPTSRFQTNESRAGAVRFERTIGASRGHDHSLDLPLPDFRPTNPVPGRFDSNVRLAPAGAMTISSTSHFPISDQRIPCRGGSIRTYDWRQQGP